MIQAALGLTTERPGGNLPGQGHGTPFQVEERMRRVLELRQAGFTNREIARTLGVGEGVVWADFRRIMTQTMAKLGPRKIWEYFLEAHLRFETLYTDAKREFLGTPTGHPNRARSLEVALKANLMDIRLLQDMRLMPKAPLEVTSEVLRHPLLANMAMDEKKQIAAGLKRFFSVLGRRRPAGEEAVEGVVEQLRRQDPGIGAIEAELEPEITDEEMGLGHGE